jgi:hypothetical protein
LTDTFAVLGLDVGRGRERRAVRLARLVHRELVPCGTAGGAISDQSFRGLALALRAGAAVIAEVEYRSFTPDGELRHMRLIDLPGDFKSRLPGELSGGQKQRICIARARGGPRHRHLRRGDLGA